jgi:plastocyanin
MKKILPFVLSLLLTTSVFATSHTVVAVGLTFSPANLTITQGDTVVFAIGGSHNVVEVSLATYNANGNTPLVGGFSLPFGGGNLIGLTAGTYYYVCSPHAAAGMKGTIIVNAPPPPPVPNVWINEIHYDNAGTDSLEGFEIAGVAGTDLSCFKVYLYNGAGGGIYGTPAVSGIIDDEGCGYGAVWFGLPTNGMQNATDGIALSYNPSGCGLTGSEVLIQFLSYEGVVNATAGIASGQSSTNIGVSENSSTPGGRSLQLAGIGTSYSDFTWTSPSPNSNGSLNPNQFLCGPPPPTIFSIISCSGTQNNVSESAGTLPTCNYVKRNQNLPGNHTVELILKSGNPLDIGNYTTQTFTFTPTDPDSLAITINITDDTNFELDETFVMALRNPSIGDQIGNDSLLTFTIIDNDPQQLTISFVTNSATVNEAAGTVNAGISVSSPPIGDITLSIQVTGGTAQSGTDFNLNTSSITLPAGSTSNQNATLSIVDDNINENLETIQIKLSVTNSGGNNISIGDSIMTINITDNDAIVITMNRSSLNVDEDAGTVVLYVKKNVVSVNPVSVSVALDGASSATAGADFTFTPAVVTFPAGVNDSIAVPVTIIDDTAPEQDETVIISLSSPTNGATLGTPSLTTIVIKTNDGLGIENAENHANFVLYPNPADDVLHIQSEIKIEKIMIHHLSGILVDSFNPMNENQLQINTSNLASGIYVISIQAESIFNKKLFIKK